MNGTMFEDPEFPADEASLRVDKSKYPMVTVSLQFLSKEISKNKIHLNSLQVLVRLDHFIYYYYIFFI